MVASERPRHPNRVGAFSVYQHDTLDILLTCYYLCSMSVTPEKRHLVVICSSISKRARELIELEADETGCSMSRAVDAAIIIAYGDKHARMARTTAEEA